MARSVRLALEGEFVPDAVNVQAGGVVAEDLRPALPLVEKLGRVFTALAGGVASSVEVLVRGEIAALDVSVLQLAALKGVFSEVVEEQVTFVNAPALAAERGVETTIATDAESPDYRNLVTVHGVLPTGEQVSVSGTLTGPRQVEKLTEVDGFDVELVAEEQPRLPPLPRPAGRRRPRRRSGSGRPASTSRAPRSAAPSRAATP